MSPEWFSAIATAIAAAAAVAAVWVAYWQLGNLSGALRMSTLNVVLQLESEMNARKEKVDEAAKKVRMEVEANGGESTLAPILVDYMNGCLETWLNSADRLAYCILKGYLKERDWRAEYRAYFAQLIQDHSTFFGPSTIYTNLLDLNNKWKRE